MFIRFTTTKNKKNKMRKNKIVIHSGHFHSDEVFACAIIKYFFGDIEIIRTRNEELLESYKRDENVFVVDVGGIYQPYRKNFDHHQDLELSSAAGLVWSYYAPQYLKTSIVEKIEIEIIRSVDWMDTNKHDIFSKLDVLNNSFDEKIKFGGISKVISLYNRDTANDELQMTQFKKAVDIAYDVIMNSIYVASEIQKEDFVWKNKITYKNFAYIFDMKCDSWYEKRNECGEKINYSITPRAEGYGIKTVDSKIYPLPTFEELKMAVDDSDIVFVHAARFLIVCKTMSSVYRILDYMIEKQSLNI